MVKTPETTIRKNPPRKAARAVPSAARMPKEKDADEELQRATKEFLKVASGKKLKTPPDIVVETVLSDENEEDQKPAAKEVHDEKGNITPIKESVLPEDVQSFTSVAKKDTRFKDVDSDSHPLDYFEAQNLWEQSPLSSKHLRQILEKVILINPDIMAYIQS